MSSRVMEKERRRAEREQAEQQLHTRERRGRRIRLAAGGAGLVAVVAGVAIAAGGGGAGPAEDPFGPNYAQLEQRMAAAGVSTMAAPSGTEHTHQQLRVVVDGRDVPVPANLGIDPARPPQEMASLHTHAEPGVLHNEGQADATLGQVFAVWGVPFAADRLGPHRGEVRMTVDGKPSRAFGDLKLRDGQEIVVSLDRAAGSPAR